MTEETHKQDRMELENVAQVLLGIRDEFMDVPSLKAYAEDLLDARDTIVRIEHRLRYEDANEWAASVAETLGIEPTDQEEAHEQHETHHHVGETLRSAREAAGLSTRRLGEQSGVDHLTITYIERGNTKYPKRTTLAKLDTVLGTELEPHGF